MTSHFALISRWMDCTGN